MRRISIFPRENWQALVESQGLSFHSMDGCYWDESACYVFTTQQIDDIEDATNELQRLCMRAVQHIVEQKRYAELAIPEPFWERIESSWRRQEPSVYGRFDLCYDGSDPPKMLEYNADTPTALLEASVVQWFWMKDVFPHADQFNSIHEKLVEKWQTLKCNRFIDRLHIASVKDSEEDYMTTAYLGESALQAGLQIQQLYVEDVGWWEERRTFVDAHDEPIHWLFKLYPWEWMIREEFCPQLLKTETSFIEPYWKMLLSNKGILPVLWELFPNHPNLLPAYFTPDSFSGSFVKKPMLSREGANIEIFTPEAVHRTDGQYGAEGWVYQAFAPLPRFGERSYAVIGSWVIGGVSAGIGIREDDSLITRNTSRFVPHYFEPEGES